MNWLNSLKVAQKLAVAFGVCLSLSVVVGIVAISHMADIESKAQTLANHALGSASASEVHQIAAITASAYASGRTLVIGLLAASIVLGIVFAMAVTRSIKTSLDEVGRRMNSLNDNCVTSLNTSILALANGDVTVAVHTATGPIDVTAKDEIGEIALTFNSMLAKIQSTITAYRSAQTCLSALIGQTRYASDTITDTAAEIASGNEDLSHRTSEQASSLEETAASMEEMTSIVKQSADNAREANKLASKARQVAEEGGDIVGSAVESMHEINAASRQINEIIAVIDEIAFQTNLLALNAAVEAARVGEQGRGFAVVASEVRNLASRSSTAAKEIKALVRDTVKKVEGGTELVNRSGEQLQEIVLAVSRVADIVSEIASAAQEQASGIEQVNRAVIQMDEVTQRNAALVEESAAASQSMSQQALDLQDLVKRFKTDAYEPETRLEIVEASTKTEELLVANGAPRSAASRETPGRPALRVLDRASDSMEEF